MSAPRSAGSRRKAPGAALCASLSLVATLAAGCANKEREAQVSRLDSKVAKERAAAIRALGALAKAGDDELWAVVERSAADTSSQVKLAVVEALGQAPQAREQERGALADDALSKLLGDGDEAVRTAAAQALGKRCGPKPIAYLQHAFGRGGAGTRSAVATALFGCGVQPEALFAHAEEALRIKALEWLGHTNSAHRAWAAGELGLLGRKQDVAALENLLDDRDGAVVAAAALGLGRAGDQKAALRLGALAGDGVPMIAAAAARALAELGPQACLGAQAALEKQAVLAGEQAVPAAVALSLALSGQEAALCPFALAAADARAAALLARGCAAGPIAEALAKQVPARGPLAEAAATRAGALLEALLQARPEPLAPSAGLALGRLAAAGAGALSERAAEAAGLLGARQAAPALLALVKSQRAARQKELALVRKPAEAPPPPPPPPSPEAGQGEPPSQSPADAQAEKYARLMQLVGQRKSQQALRAGASERLAALLRGEASPVQARKLLVVALRSLLALGVPEARAEAALLAADPDPELSAAAKTGPAAPAAVTARDVPAPVEATRRALWSTNGAERAAACTALAGLSDAASAPLRAALTADPEQRVRAACAAKKETGPAGAR